MKIGSLFSGVGGLDLGLERAGLGQVIWQVESDPFCRKVLKKHWPKADQFVDVRGVIGMGWLKKLTEEQAASAVRDYQGGDSLGVIGARYGTSRQAMWDLLRRRTTMRQHTPIRKEVPEELSAVDLICGGFP